MPAVVRSGPGGSEQSKLAARSPAWWAGTQVLELSSWSARLCTRKRQELKNRGTGA